MRSYRNRKWPTWFLVYEFFTDDIIVIHILVHVSADKPHTHTQNMMDRVRREEHQISSSLFLFSFYFFFFARENCLIAAINVGLNRFILKIVFCMACSKYYLSLFCFVCTCFCSIETDFFCAPHTYSSKVWELHSSLFSILLYRTYYIEKRQCVTLVC